MNLKARVKQVQEERMSPPVSRYLMRIVTHFGDIKAHRYFIMPTSGDALSDAREIQRRIDIWRGLTIHVKGSLPQVEAALEDIIKDVEETNLGLWLGTVHIFRSESDKARALAFREGHLV